MSNGKSNGNGRSYSPLPPLSLSILGVEPLDEFIREVADFIHHMISTRPEGAGQVEVEAKIGVLRDKMSGQRIQLPVLVETSACTFTYGMLCIPCSIDFMILLPNCYSEKYSCPIQLIVDLNPICLQCNISTSTRF